MFLLVELAQVCPYTRVKNKQQSKDVRDKRRDILLNLQGKTL